MNGPESGSGADHPKFDLSPGNPLNSGPPSNEEKASGQAVAGPSAPTLPSEIEKRLLILEGGFDSRLRRLEVYEGLLSKLENSSLKIQAHAITQTQVWLHCAHWVFAILMSAGIFVAGIVYKDPETVRNPKVLLIKIAILFIGDFAYAVNGIGIYNLQKEAQMMVEELKEFHYHGIEFKSPTLVIWVYAFMAAVVLLFYIGIVFI